MDSISLLVLPSVKKNNIARVLKIRYVEEYVMKLAFSTLACPNFSWPEIYSMAKDIGFDGIEIRGLGKDIFAVKSPPFTEAQLPETVRKLNALRLEIPCLSSDCCLKFADKAEENKKEITEYIQLAQKISCPYVRVLADLAPMAQGEVDDEIVLAQIRELIPLAEQAGVTLLIETNGVYADTARLRKLLERLSSDTVAALWDMHHPYRFMGEQPEQTVQNLGAYIKYVHVKDSIMTDGKVEYRMMGEGDLPIREMMRALQSICYEGYVSLEWVKRWSSSLSDAGIVSLSLFIIWRVIPAGILPAAFYSIIKRKRENISGKKKP